MFGATAYKSIAGGTGSSNVNKAHITDISTGLEKGGYTLSNRLKGLYTKFVEFQNDLLDKHPESTDWEKLSYNRTVIAEMDLSKAESIIGQEAKIPTSHSSSSAGVPAKSPTADWKVTFTLRPKKNS